MLQAKTESFLSKVYVLYINSSQDVCEKLTRILGPAHLKAVEDIAGWRNAYDNTPADIVIMGISEGISELLIVEELQNLNPHLPIIVITDHNDEAFLLSLIALGVDRYLKPSAADDELLEAITAVARTVEYRKEIEAKNQFIEVILDIIPSMLAILRQNKVTYMNKTFMEYLGVSGVDEFHRHYPGLISLLVNKDPQLKDDGMLSVWANNQTAQLMHPSNGDIQSFLLASVPVPGEDNSYFLSFTNITNLEREKQHYQHLAEYDMLTKIFNRAKINKELDKEITRVLRYGQRLSALMIDVDHFKNVNDTYGHQVGDVVLSELAALLADKVRKTDILGRYGGEEFIILMPSTSIESAYDIAERIRVHISIFKFTTTGKITCSIGVAEYHRGESAVSFVKRTDDALYMAKHNGRNKVEVLHASESE